MYRTIADIEKAGAEAKDPSLRSRSLTFKTIYITADSTDLQMTEKARRITLGLQILAESPSTSREE